MTTTSTTPADRLPDELLSVAMVTLGCARNEVDSEELAGRLEAGGLPAGRGPGRRRHRGGQHLRVRRVGQEGLGRHPAGGRRPQGHRSAPRPSSRSAAWPSATARSWPSSLPEADAVLGFDDYPDIAARLRSIVAGETHQAHTPQDRRKLLPITPVERALSTAAGRPATRPVPPSLRRRLESGPTASLKLASGCDRRCSFCAIPSFRGSFVSRRPSDVLQEAPLAGRAGRARAVPGQRELHVVRQGPRRPAAARDAAARAGRRRRRRAGAGLLPPARRDPARAGPGDRGHARRDAVLRPVLPARQRRRCCAGCAASATPRASSGLLEQIRAISPVRRACAAT